MIGRVSQLNFHAVFVGGHLVAVNGQIVGDHNAFVADVFAQKLHDLRIGIDPFTVDLVIGAHDHPGLGLLQDHLPGAQIDLMQGALGDHGVGVHPVVFLVVGDKVLGAGADALFLHPLDILRRQQAGEDGVLTEIVIVAAAKGATLEIHAGAVENIDSLGIGLGLLCHALPDLPRQRPVPTHGNGGVGGISHRVISTVGRAPVCVLGDLFGKTIRAAAGHVLRYRTVEIL